jgi:hypothetical protein
MPTYKTNKEIFEAIDDNRMISGVIEVDWNCSICDTTEIKYCYSKKLIGEEYGWFLEDLTYRLVGCNVVQQTILVEVTANAEKLMFDSTLTRFL